MTPARYGNPRCHSSKLWIAALTLALSLLGGAQALAPASAVAMDDPNETVCVAPEGVEVPVGELVCVVDEVSGSYDPGPATDGPGYGVSTGDDDPVVAWVAAEGQRAVMRRKEELAAAKRRLREAKTRRIGEERVLRRAKKLRWGCKYPYELIQRYYWVEYMRDTKQWSVGDYVFKDDFLGSRRVTERDLDYARATWMEHDCPGPIPGDET